jgi:chemotaxis signal transduction protein
MSAAREAILRFFREPPRLTAEDLGILFETGGQEFFLEASEIVEITPPLPVSGLPGSPHGVAFWRGRAVEVRGVPERAHYLLLVRGRPLDFFVVSENRPAAVSRSDVPAAALYREPHGER